MIFIESDEELNDQFQRLASNFKIASGDNISSLTQAFEEVASKLNLIS